VFYFVTIASSYKKICRMSI